MEILPKFSAQRLSTRVAITGLIAAIIVAERRLSATGATVMLLPGNNLRNALAASPPGTTFVLPARHLPRGASLTSLKDRDSFIGRPGAITDGAKQLSG